MTVKGAEPGTAMMNLLLGAVPERRAELEDLWASYSPNVRVVEDGPRLKLSTKGQRIAFSAKTLDVYWLIGLNGWLALEAYSTQVLLSSELGCTIGGVVQVDKDLEGFERAYRERRATARLLAEAIDISQVAWPPDLPRPSADRNAIPGSQYHAAFDLTLLAVAALLLHEFRHVMLAVDRQQQVCLRDEEMACDVWAREFMTVKAGLYAEQRDHAYSEVIRKRSMALALASVMIHDTTPVWERLGVREHWLAA